MHTLCPSGLEPDQAGPPFRHSFALITVPFLLYDTLLTFIPTPFRTLQGWSFVPLALSFLTLFNLKTSSGTIHPPAHPPFKPPFSTSSKVIVDRYLGFQLSLSPPFWTRFYLHFII